MSSVRQRVATLLLEASVRGENALRRFIPQDNLAILDNMFPQRFSAFRITEFTAYLEAFPRAVVYSTGESFSLIGDSRGFRRVLAEYRRHYPRCADRVRQYHPARKLSVRLAYSVFLDNAAFFLDALEAARIPFAYTLYPGGGFRLNDAVSDAALQRVGTSPCLRRIIATQKITADYLRGKPWCRNGLVEFIYGAPVPVPCMRQAPPRKRRYGRDKDTLDVCFVAAKNMSRGVDKGYDVFVDVAQRLRAVCPDVRFHVVGGFTAADIALGELGRRTTFYGHLYTEALQALFSTMDVMLSPNVPFKLAPGAFDGFPTACCVEGALNGVAVFCTDELGQNVCFRNREDIVLIPRDADAIAGLVQHYCENPDELYVLAEKGQIAFRRAFSFQAQIEPRLAVLSACLQQTPAHD